MPYLQARGAKLYYETSGLGEPIVFLHEFADDYRSWDTQTPFFSQCFRCICFNARGYPPSDTPLDPNLYGLDLAVSDLEHVLDGLAIARAHLVGLSMGAATALEFAVRNPSRVLSLVLASIGSGSHPESAVAFRQSILDSARLLKDQGLNALFERYQQMPARTTLQEKHPARWASFKRRFLERSLQGTVLTLENVHGKRIPITTQEHKLRALNVPALILKGEKDAGVESATTFLHDTLPRARLITFPATGHAVNIEEPERFNASAARFLNRIRPVATDPLQ